MAPSASAVIGLAGGFPAKSSRIRPRSVKVARSFFCIFTGWCVAIITLVCWQVFRPGFGYVTDFSFFLSWTALFGFFGWLVSVVPAVLRIEDDNRWLQFPLSLVTGA